MGPIACGKDNGINRFLPAIAPHYPVFGKALEHRSLVRPASGQSLPVGAPIVVHRGAIVSQPLGAIKATNGQPKVDIAAQDSLGQIVDGLADGQRDPSHLGQLHPNLHSAVAAAHEQRTTT